MTYFPRIADKELATRLASTGAVVIEGPKAYEIKLGTGHIDAGAASLLKFADRFDTCKCGSPVQLGVIVGTGYGYMRKDGVAVIPVGALGP